MNKFVLNCPFTQASFLSKGQFLSSTLSSDSGETTFAAEYIDVITCSVGFFKLNASIAFNVIQSWADVGLFLFSLKIMNDEKIENVEVT